MYICYSHSTLGIGLAAFCTIYDIPEAEKKENAEHDVFS